MTATTTKNRIDVVFIRKSTQSQDEGGQTGNVGEMLRKAGVHVADANWFVGTVSRRKVKANAQFVQLMQLVEADKVATVYVESQDRWGTADRAELFTLLGTLRGHGTRLYDLRAGKDLTEKDVATELLAFVNSVKSEKELQDIAYRSLRTRVNNFKDTGSWPTGTHPYGYGKRCYSPDRRVLWEFQPVNRSKGQVFYPDADGTLVAGPTDVRIPSKDKRDVVKLVPSNNPDFVRAVKLVFDLYTRVGLSRRQISTRLNGEGLTFNGGPFTHPDVQNILTNPAYMGDTHFGKVQTGELHTFDANGILVEVKAKRERPRRAISERLVRENTHEPLVDRKTWQLAQQKLTAEKDRTSFSPRNPAYYLKQLFVCAHCGKGMRGRCESYPGTKVKTVVYVCSSYINGRIGGYQTKCGYHRITHADAERMLLDKIAERGIPFDVDSSTGARANLEARLDRLGYESDESHEQWHKWVEEGVEALIDYLKETYGANDDSVRRLSKAARSLYSWGWLTKSQIASLPASPTAPLPTPAESRKAMRDGPTPDQQLALNEFKKVLQKSEATIAAEAERKVANLSEDHKTYTLAWAKANDLQQGVLKQELTRLEEELSKWKPRATPLRMRLEAFAKAEAERNAEFQKIRDEWPTLESREKGEALRRLFKTVRLSWEPHFHPPSAKPTRPRKTKREGRYSYTLQTDRTEWYFVTSDLESSW
jgi:hypothetical protein